MDPVRSVFGSTRELELLPNAMITSCGHNFEEERCLTLFGKIIGGVCEKQGEACPTCKQVVTDYRPDYELRSMVEYLRGLNIFHNPNSKNCYQKVAVPPSDISNQAPYEPPFPGKPAKFVHTKGEWNKWKDMHVEVKKFLTFKSESVDSFFSEFSLYQYCGGEKRIIVHFQKDVATAELFFRYHNITIRPFDIMLGTYHTKNAAELKAMFEILDKNNEIPKSHHFAIKYRVEAYTDDFESSEEYF